MAKFRVGDTSSTSFPIGNSRCQGGTWYSPGDVGVAEEVLARDYPFLEWDSEPKRYTEKPKEIKPAKLSKEEFISLTRDKQEKLLNKMGVIFTIKDTEKKLWEKYAKA